MMNVRTVKSRINGLIERATLYYDRIRIYCDTDRPLISAQETAEFKQRGTKINVEQKLMSEYNPRFQQKIDILQPRLDDLLQIARILDRQRLHYRITRVELACDWATKNTADVSKLRQIIQSSFYSKKQQPYFNTFEGTDYYAGRKRKGQAVIPVIYTRPKEKCFSDRRIPCIHLEFRLITSTICRKNKIYTVQDLIDYDLKAYFEERLGFYPKPTKTQCGKLISGHTTHHRDTYMRRCDQFIAKEFQGEFTYETISLMALLTTVPELEARFKKGKKLKKNKLYAEKMRAALLEKACSIYNNISD